MPNIETEPDRLFVEAADPRFIAQARISKGSKDAFDGDISKPEESSRPVAAQEIALSALSKLTAPLNTAAESLRRYRRQRVANEAVKEVWRPRYQELV